MPNWVREAGRIGLKTVRCQIAPRWSSVEFWRGAYTPEGPTTASLIRKFAALSQAEMTATIQYTAGGVSLGEKQQFQPTLGFEVPLDM